MAAFTTTSHEAKARLFPLLHQHGSHPSTDPNCVTVLRASIMGGATYKYCGTKAIAACKQFAAQDKGLAVQCEKRGLWRRRSTR